MLTAYGLMPVCRQTRPVAPVEEEARRRGFSGKQFPDPLE